MVPSSSLSQLVAQGAQPEGQSKQLAVLSSVLHVCVLGEVVTTWILGSTLSHQQYHVWIRFVGQ